MRLIGGRSLARAMVPLTEKLMTDGVPDISRLASPIAARSEPEPASFRLVTVKMAMPLLLRVQFSAVSHPARSAGEHGAWRCRSGVSAHQLSSDHHRTPCC